MVAGDDHLVSLLQAIKDVCNNFENSEAIDFIGIFSFKDAFETLYNVNEAGAKNWVEKVNQKIHAGSINSLGGFLFEAHKEWSLLHNGVDPPTAKRWPKNMLENMIKDVRSKRALENQIKDLEAQLEQSENAKKGLEKTVQDQSKAKRDLEKAMQSQGAQAEAEKSALQKELRDLKELLHMPHDLGFLRGILRQSCARKIQRMWRKRIIALSRYREQIEQSMGLQRPTTRYDIVLAFQSLDKFITEGKIDFLRASQSNFEIAKKTSVRIIAVVGLFDKGKTYLLNKLFGVNLPSGKMCTTRGLSFLWIEERRMLLLDSAGVQNTVSYRAQAVQPILDAQTTESLIFEMVSRIAHHLIFVVNDLTWFEQKYIAMLHQKYVKAGEFKELIVVHNLRSTSIIHEARALFKQQITQCYDGERSHLGELVFIAKHGEVAPPVHHLGICQEGSAAGMMFNDTNCTLLLQQLEHRNALGSQLSLADVLESQYSFLLGKFVNVEADHRKLVAEEQQKRLTVRYTPRDQVSDPEDGYVQVGTFDIDTAGRKVTMKTRGVITSLGEIIAHDDTFEPVVNVYDTSGASGMLRMIRIECPGITEDDIEWEEVPNGIKVTITKPKGIDEKSVQPVHPIRQHHGTWEREFVFDVAEGHFEIRSPEEFELTHGVLSMPLHRASPRKGKLGKHAIIPPVTPQDVDEKNAESNSAPGSFSMVQSKNGSSPP